MPRVCKNGKDVDSEFSKLHKAVEAGDLKKVRALIQTGLDVDRRASPDGPTPLWGAVRSENVQIMKELIRAGADPNIEGPHHITPLISGIFSRNVKVVQTLLDNGADMHLTLQERHSVLHVCAGQGCVKIVRLLLERGLDVDIRNDHNETPLHVAAQMGHREVVQLLLAKGANIHATCTPMFQKGDQVDLGSNVTALFLAGYGQHPEVVDILIKAGADVTVKTSQNHTTLLFPAESGSLKVVTLLLNAGAKSIVNVQSNYAGYTPLLLAAKNGNTDIVKALLNVEGIDINPLSSTEETPLIMAAGSGHLEVIKVLLAKGVPVNSRGFGQITALYVALMSKEEAVARFLLKNGADACAIDSHKATPLSVACEKNISMDILETLVANGANVNARNIEGVRPIHCVASRGLVHIVKFLIDHGADCDALDGYGLTALHLAAKSGELETVAYLATKVSDINTATLVKCCGSLTDPDVTCCGSFATALHLAVEHGHLEVVKILCANGANVNASDGAKRTPLHIAVRDQRLEIAEYLLKHNACVNSKQKKGYTPLYMAVKGQTDIFDLTSLSPHLLYEEMKPVFSGQSNLEEKKAISIKRDKFVSLLLDNGADVNAADKRGVLPIHVAVSAKYIDIVRALLAKGAKFNVEVQKKKYSGTPLKIAHKTKNPKLIGIFELISDLFSAVIENNMCQMECVIKAGAAVNARNASGRTVLHYAVSENNIKAVKLLLANGVDISLAADEGDSPLHIAAENGCVKIAESLLTHAKNASFVKYNSIVNAKTTFGTTVLHTAVKSNSLEIVKLLLSNGAVYNAKNSCKKAPVKLTAVDETIKTVLLSTEELFKAVKEKDGFQEVKRILEDNNCVVNARAVDGGGTPLYWAVSKGHSNIAHVLLSNDADYYLVTNKGTTPLHIAASKGNVEIVKALIDRVKKNNTKKATDFINAATTSGTVALHVASNLEIVKYLLQAGATYNIANGEEKTALELTKNIEVRKLLKMTDQLFVDVKKGGSTVINTLDGLKADEFKAVAKTRNEQGQTLLQLALANGHVKIGGKLAEKLKRLS